jgi:hypothetical protein
MTAFKDISLSELAGKNKRESRGIVKSGVSKGGGEFKDPFTLSQPFPVEITGEEITFRPSGTPQLALSLSIINDDGSLTKAGKVWLDLPLTGSAEMSAEEEAEHVAKAGKKFLGFLRALRPEEFSVFAEIDKTDAKKWVYRDHDGKALTEKAREKKAAEIENAMFSIADGLMDGGLSLAGSQCVLTKVPNPNNAKYPYNNFSAIDAEGSF